MFDRVFCNIYFIPFEIGCPYCYCFLLYINFRYYWVLFLFSFCLGCSIWIDLVCFEMHCLVLIFLQKNRIVISIEFMNGFFSLFLSHVLTIFLQVFCLELIGNRCSLSFFLFSCNIILGIISLFVHQRRWLW